MKTTTIETALLVELVQSLTDAACLLQDIYCRSNTHPDEGQTNRVQLLLAIRQKLEMGDTPQSQLALAESLLMVQRMTTTDTALQSQRAFTYAGKPLKDTRPPRGFWAPGNYVNVCTRCKQHFFGEKHSCICAPCAYGDQDGKQV